MKKLLMSRSRKIGIIFILIGFTLPLVLFAFASDYYPGAGILGSLSMMKLVISEEIRCSNIKVEPGSLKSFKEASECGILKGPDPIIKRERAIPYKYILAIGIILISIGIGMVIMLPGQKIKGG